MKYFDPPFALATGFPFEDIFLQAMQDSFAPAPSPVANHDRLLPNIFQIQLFDPSLRKPLNDELGFRPEQFQVANLFQAQQLLARLQVVLHFHQYFHK